MAVRRQAAVVPVLAPLVVGQVAGWLPRWWLVVAEMMAGRLVLQALRLGRRPTGMEAFLLAG